MVVDRVFYWIKYPLYSLYILNAVLLLLLLLQEMIELWLCENEPSLGRKFAPTAIPATSAGRPRIQAQFTVDTRPNHPNSNPLVHSRCVHLSRSTRLLLLCLSPCGFIFEQLADLVTAIIFIVTGEISNINQHSRTSYKRVDSRDDGSMVAWQCKRIGYAVA